MRYTVLFLISIFIGISHVNAIDMESTRFRIESGTIDFTTPEKPSTTTQRSKTSDSQQFDSDGIIIKTDSVSTESTPLRFIIEKSLLTMGNVSPNSPSLLSSTVSIAGGRSVYQVLVSESDFLRKLSGETIPDTFCSSQKKCTPSIAARWDSLSVSGFGYTLEGQDIPNDFLNKDYFRPFPNSKKAMPPAILMKGLNKTDEKHSTVTLKTIVSAIQADGTYENTINFIAVPGY